MLNYFKSTIATQFCANKFSKGDEEMINKNELFFICKDYASDHNVQFFFSRLTDELSKIISNLLQTFSTYFTHINVAQMSVKI